MRRVSSKFVLVAVLGYLAVGAAARLAESDHAGAIGSRPADVRGRPGLAESPEPVAAGRSLELRRGRAGSCLAAAPSAHAHRRGRVQGGTAGDGVRRRRQLRDGVGWRHGWPGVARARARHPHRLARLRLDWRQQLSHQWHRRPEAGGRRSAAEAGARRQAGAADRQEQPEQGQRAIPRTCTARPTRSFTPRRTRCSWPTATATTA